MWCFRLRCSSGTEWAMCKWHSIMGIACRPLHYCSMSQYNSDSQLMCIRHRQSHNGCNFRWRGSSWWCMKYTHPVYSYNTATHRPNKHSMLRDKIEHYRSYRMFSLYTRDIHSDKPYRDKHSGSNLRHKPNNSLDWSNTKHSMIRRADKYFQIYTNPRGSWDTYFAL